MSFIDIPAGRVSCKVYHFEERLGNPPPRIAETCVRILNSVGLQNPGLDSFISTYLPWLKKQDTAVIANIAGSTVEYCEIAERLSGTDVDIIELNISCRTLSRAGSVRDVLRKCRKGYVRLKTLGKAGHGQLTPNVTDIGDIAKAAEDAGADALSLINTITGMRIDIKTRRPVLRNNTGGLSGPAVFPVAVRMVHEVYKRVNIPVVGMGGITKWEDAAEMMIAGASAVQVGTANFRDPFACIRIIEGLERFAASLGLKSIAELTGTVLEW